MRHFIEHEYLRTHRSKQAFSSEIFAEEVSYYDRGIVSRHQIVEEKRRYFARWPKIDYALLRQSVVARCLTEGLFVAEFWLDYALHGDLKSPTGRASVELVVRRHHERFEIVAEDGATL